MWDTALAIIALNDAGLPGDHPALERAGRWLLGEEVRVRGDWAVQRSRLEPGGWAFEFANVNYPDVDDTAEVVMALERLAPGLDGLAGARERAVAWTAGMQSSDGGWGAFDADNTRALVRELPFLDFGEVIDEPSADVTAHTIEMLGLLGRGEEPATKAGVRWLLEHQETDGSWYGRWGINHVYGTGAAVPGLVAAGVLAAEHGDQARGRLARAPPERGRRLGRGRALLRRPALDRARPEHRLADRMGAARAARRRRRRRGDGQGRSLARVHPAARRRLGRAAVHGHRVPLRLLHQLPPLQDQLPRDGARALPGGDAAAVEPARDEREVLPQAHREPGVIASPHGGADAFRGDRLSGCPHRRRAGAPSAEAVMARAAGENFPVASRLLPRAEREHLLAVYGYRRLVDELGDSPEIAPAERPAALDWLEGGTRRRARG